MVLLRRVSFTGTILLALALLGYSVARASLVSYNNDEALTFLYHARSSVVDIVNYNSRIMPSNNHLLNSLLMKLSAAFLGESELALRLPNVLAHAAYLVVSVLLARRYSPLVLQPFALALLTLNPYLLEFFSLSRGYGLAVAAMMWSLFFAIRALEGQRSIAVNLWLAAGLAGLTVLCSIPFVNFFIASMTLLAVIATWRQRVYERLSLGSAAWWVRAAGALLPLLVVGAALTAIMLPPILKLRQLNHFYIGGKTSFWTDTVGSLVDGSLYNAPYEQAAAPLVLASIAAIVVASAGLLSVRLWRGQRDGLVELSAILLALLVLMAVSSILQHQMLGVNYLKGRIGIMFVPIFALLVISLPLSLAAALPNGRARQLSQALLVLLAGLVVFHALQTLNTSYSMVLRGNASTRQMMDELTVHYAATHDHESGTKVTVGVSAIFKPVVEYYTISRQLEWVKIEEFNTLKEDYDYYYYDTEDGRVLNRKNLIWLATYPSTGGVLAAKVPD